MNAPFRTTTAARTRRASAKHRAQARAVAHFTSMLASRDSGLNTKATLALVSRMFPAIRLDTALAGLIFQELFLKQDRGRRTQKGDSMSVPPHSVATTAKAT